MEKEYTGNERRKNVVEHICQKEDEIDNISKDINVVKADITTIKNDKIHTNELLTTIQTQLIKMEKRLYIDNGTLSIQTILRDGAAKMSKIEADIIATNNKLAEVEDQPRKYAIYTVGVISLLGALCGLIIWISVNTKPTESPYHYTPIPTVNIAK